MTELKKTYFIKIHKIITETIPTIPDDVADIINKYAEENHQFIHQTCTTGTRRKKRKRSQCISPTRLEY